MTLMGDSSTLCGCYDGEGYGPISPLQDIAPCFLNGILTNALCGLFIICGSFEISRLRQKPNISCKRTPWFPFKLACTALQVVFEATAVGYYTSNAIYENADVTFLNDSQWWSTVMALAATSLSLLLVYVERYKSFISSPSVILFWMLCICIGFFRIINAFLRTYSVFETFLIVATTANAILILCLEASYSPRHLYNITDKYSTRDLSNLWELMVFSWLSPLVKKGYNKYLGLADVPPLPVVANAETTLKTLKKNWNDELQKAQRTGKGPSLSWAIIKSFGFPFFIGGLFELVRVLAKIFQPALLKELIFFVEQYNKGEVTSIIRGLMIVLLIFGLSTLQTLGGNQYIASACDMGVKIKSSLSCLIYEKAAVLSIEARGQKSSGDIVNLMAVDTQRLQSLTQNIQMLWSGPLLVVFCLFSLYQLVGNAMWLGFFLLFITVPLSTAVSKVQKRLQRLQMGVKDKRTGLMSEILNNIKSLKLYAWEGPYKDKLLHVRNDQELKNLRNIGVLQAANQFIFNAAPSFVSTSTFALFMAFTPDIPLSAGIAFTALSLFNLLEFPLNQIPWAISDLVEAMVSVRRVSDFLQCDELDPAAVTHVPADEDSAKLAPSVMASITNGTFLWSKNPRKVALESINYTAKDFALNCLVGKVGSGKSAVLQSFLGNLAKEPGAEVVVKGAIAYVPQVPWLINATIKENILFGFKENPEFYRRTIEACDLDQDFKMFTAGDKTQVGEKGISLSGGQKARLSLARAVYSRADVYLLDDILSAVDEHVGSHIIKRVLGPAGLLQDRCKILATNNLHVLRYADKITMLAEGKIVEEGSYAELVSGAEKTLVGNLLEIFGTEKDKQAESTDSESSTKEEVKEKETTVGTSTVTSEGTSEGTSDNTSAASSVAVAEHAVLEDYETVLVREQHDEAAAGRSEKWRRGKVTWHVYFTYMKACGVLNVIFYLTMIVMTMGAAVLSNVWLKHWSELNERAGGNPNGWTNVGIYFAICMSSALFSLLQTLSQWLLCSIRGSRVLHQGMLDSVMTAPMTFFETTPIGRVLNRFSNDIFKIDETLFRVFAFFFSAVAKVMFTFIVIIASTWQFIFFGIPLAFVYKYYQDYYIATSRELRRLDSITKSPIFAQFEETLTGIVTIRAYNQMDRFEYMSRNRIDKNLSAYHPAMMANRWLGVRLEFIGSIVILLSSGLLVLNLGSGKVTSGLVGLSVSYALQVTESMNRIVRMSAKIEAEIVSVERIDEYSRLPSEAPAIIENHRPEIAWPVHGLLKFDNYSTRYRKDLDLVLKKINLTIQSGEKVGIVGRTGAGKSSLTLALFRLIEAAEGSVTIDGVNTSEIGLFDLRSKLSIIPQDAQMFQGTIRSNLDPTDQYPDEVLWEALRLSSLEEYVRAMYDDFHEKADIGFNPLLLEVSEGGSNFSVGQRQLMCLARALCKKESKVLVLDEATANVDVRTDSIIQGTIRSAFKERTVLTIAHRLNTIIDSDKILVLERGEVMEFDTPAKLLENKDSLFYALCSEGGLVEKKED